MKFRIVIWAVVLAAVVCGYAISTSAQSSGSISGTVKDQSGASIAGAQVTLSYAVSGYHREAATDVSGNFSFANLPFNSYHLTASATGFTSVAQDVDVRSNVPANVQISLKIGAAATTVTVEGDAGDLVEKDSTFHTDVDRGLFDKLPLESASSSVSSLVTLSTPGVAADSNGLFHGLGDHASNSFSVDGQPITDQQSKVFSNQIPADSIQSLEVISGAPPAEFGDKTSLVIKVTTRSGQGVKPAHGSVNTSYGSFGSATGAFDVAYGGTNWGNFIAANVLNTGRFLDGPDFSVTHDKGNQENLFDRVDYQVTQANAFHLNVGYTRSWFQTPNSYDAKNATAWNGLVVDNGGLGPDGLPVEAQDQRSKITTFNVAPTFTRLLSTESLFTLGGFVRRDEFNYYPSGNAFADLTPGLQLQSIGQNRTLTNAGARSDISYVKGVHNVKVGALYEQTFLKERDRLGIVDPTFNAVCLNADGSFNTNPGITDPAACGGAANPGGSANAGFVPLLGCYDLTRTAALPATDNCPNATSSSYLFRGHTDVKELALYVQDSISVKNWNFNFGIRGDLYNGLTAARQAEPRLGVAYNIKQTNTVLRVSYARTLETPFNENLVLASEGCNDPVINGIETITQGSPCLTQPLKPGWRNEFHAGFQQGFGKFLVVDGEYIWKYTHLAYDFSVLGNTPITFPIEWHNSKIPGFALRASLPNYHGLTAFVVMSSVAARFFTPQVSGIGATPGGSDVFRIDHDEKFNQTTHLQYQPWKVGPWIGFNWRYDSGLVAGPVPCAGGNCKNGPNGTDTIVDASGLTPDQQFEAGLFCGSVHATPTMGISPNGLCAASSYGSTLIKIPAAGTENADKNPPRIAPRNLFDVSVGDDNLFKGDHYKWSVRLTAVNVTDDRALYNFLSTFSGTHYVTPRSMTAEVGFHF